MTDGFLGRWSLRKQAQRAGKPLVEPVTERVEPQAICPLPEAAAEPGLPSREHAPPLTLDDVQGLTAQSDFTPFVARGVAPEVRNAAMKKLFADPHYNVMDGMDTYIDDYSLADPLPEAMLRQMASASFLKLFEVQESMAQSTQTPPGGHPPISANTPVLTRPDHDHTDLRLQPNDAAGREGPGSGIE
jgi:hypothetical protein